MVCIGLRTGDCDDVRSVELTVDTRRRAQYLKLAREWTEAADALEASTQ
jgi:hypothetical protein